MVTSFKAREGTFAYGNSAVTWDAATEGDAENLTANVGSLKNITVTLPEQEFEKIDLLGNLQQTIGANAETAGTATGITPGYWQSQALIPNSISTWKMAGTAVFTGDEQFFHVLGLGTSQAAGSNTRYRIGTLTSGAAFTQNFLGVLRMFLNNGSQDVNLIGTNVKMKLGEVRPTGADGHWEADFEAMGLAHDFAIEFLD